MTEIVDWLQGFVVDQQSPTAVTGWVSTTADAIIGDVELPDDIRPILIAAIEEHWLAFLGGVAVDDAGATELVPAAGDLSVQIARHHLGLPVLLKIYQSAQEASWDFAVGVVGHAPPDLDHESLLVWFWTKANRWFATSVELSVALYQEEVDRIRRRGDARRYELVADVLAGRSATHPNGIRAEPIPRRSDSRSVSLPTVSTDSSGRTATPGRHNASRSHRVEVVRSRPTRTWPR